MKRFLVISVLTFFIINLQAQKENHNWFFGDYAGLTWNTTRSFPGTGMWGTANATIANIPTTIPSSMKTSEGCFSISDIDGDLLFYSDGITIWNKNGAPMQNGENMTGHSSSTQSGVIVPYPEDPNKYIAFTLGYGMEDNLSYSVVDMRLDNGLGGVEADKKNIRLAGYGGTLGESLTAIRHQNREDFWLVAAGRGTPKAYLNVWKVDNTGVVSAPHQVYDTNIDIPPSTSPGGSIASSQEGDKYVWCNYMPDAATNNVFFLFGKFNNETGKVENMKTKMMGNYYTVAGTLYGAAFNKTGDYIYITSLAGSKNNTAQSVLSVFNFNDLMAATNTSTITPKRSILAGNGLPNNGVNDHFGALGLAPNGYLYIIHPFSRNLYVITNPDTPTSMNIYKLSNLLSVGTQTVFGMPTAAAPWFRFQIIPPPESVACNSVDTRYELKIFGGEGFENMKYLTIDFGDNMPESLIKIDSPAVGSLYRNHTYSHVGDYTITIKAYEQPDKLMQGMEKQSTIKVRSCSLPINPNIHQY